MPNRKFSKFVLWRLVAFDVSWSMDGAANAQRSLRANLARWRA